MTFFHSSVFPLTHRFTERSFGPHRILMSSAVSSLGNEYKSAWTAKGSGLLPFSKKSVARSYSGVKLCAFCLDVLCFWHVWCSAF